MIRILTDSAADLTAADARRPGVEVVPLHVLFADGTTVRDGVDITNDEFYHRLRGADKLPRTSQPSPEDFMKVYESAKQAGDTVIGIFIASTLSGTFQCAKLAAEACEFEDVYFIDSGTGSQGEGILIREALRLRDEGTDAAEIAAALEELKTRIRILAVVDSLKHLHKGGRLPGAVAFVGGALGIKPVLAVQDGKIHLADTARGRPGAFVALFKQIEKLGGVDARYGYALIYSDERLTAGPLHHYAHNTLHLSGAHVGQLGATIGTHVGPGCAGICFVAKEPDKS